MKTIDMPSVRIETLRLPNVMIPSIPQNQKTGRTRKRSQPDLLLESGFHFLLENGGRILLENQ